MSFRHFLGFVTLFALLPPAAAAPPTWWATGNPPIITGTEANNRAPATIGQAKWMVTEALRTLDTAAPTLALQIRADLAGTAPDFTHRIIDLTVPNPKSPSWLAAQKSPLLLGQLKAISAPFYTRLAAAYPTWLTTERTTNATNLPNSIFPWTTTPDDDQNKATATLGQLKAVFSLRFETLPPEFVDSDYDGMPDNWEVANGLEPLDDADADGDPDGDGIQNQYEYALGFNPRLATTSGTPDSTKDRDGDGMKDRQEAATGSFIWNSALQRYTFVRVLNWEVPDANGDYDQDGLTNILELVNTTDVDDSDTDGDYLPDGWEIQNNLVAASRIQINGTLVYGYYGINGRTGDPDGDGIENQYEYALGFNPRLASVDGIADVTKDRDGDGMKDWQEATTGSFKWDSTLQRYVFTRILNWESAADAALDPDADGLSNLAEYQNSTNPFGYDTDGDYLPDGWEIQNNLVAASSILINGTLVYGSNGINGRTGDPDGDSIENQYEYALGFNPRLASVGGVADVTKDRDGDGMRDWQEAKSGLFIWDDILKRYIFQRRLNWEQPEPVDVDGDGLSNLQEIDTYQTNPINPDTDRDSLPDGWEIEHYLNPLDEYDRYTDYDNDGLGIHLEFQQGSSDRLIDSDGDQWNDYQEYASGSNPNLQDSDGDGLSDFDEDFDLDGLTNQQEMRTYQTLPLVADTDGDGLKDGFEIAHSDQFDPREQDSYVDVDADGLLNAEEIIAGTSSTVADTDADGIEDGMEIRLGYNPIHTDSDSDGLSDSSEDYDNDGLTNSTELRKATDLARADTDSDGTPDSVDPDPRGDGYIND